MYVVNALLHKEISNPYLSRYNSSAINVNTDTSSKSINTKPMGTISYAIYINWKLETTNAKPMGMILNLFIKTGKDNYFAVNSSVSLYQLMYF